ncbi:unnamed protein product [Sympodiomycopsis kandeliae]
MATSSSPTSPSGTYSSSVSSMSQVPGLPTLAPSSSHRPGPSTNSTIHGSSSVIPTLSGSSGGKEGLNSLLTSRIATLVYLKSVLSGRRPHASLVLFSQRDLQAVYDSERMRKRSHRHLLLGLALSSALELTSIQDFTKAVLTAFNDVDSLPENYGAAHTSGSSAGTSGAMASLGLGSLTRSEGRGMRNLFSGKLKTSKKGTFSDLYAAEGLGNASVPSSAIQGGPSSSGLSGAHDGGIPGGVLPFSPDFMQVFFTLADILIEVYSKLILLLGRDSKPVPPASLSSIRSKQALHSAQASTSSFQSHHLHPTSSPPLGGPPTVPSVAGAEPPEHDFIPIPSTTSASTTDSITKVDNKIKKIIVQITKELDTVSRHIIKDELGQLENGSIPTSTSKDNPNSAAGSAMGPIAPWTGLPQPPQPPSSSSTLNVKNTSSSGGTVRPPHVSNSSGSSFHF